MEHPDGSGEWWPVGLDANHSAKDPGDLLSRLTRVNCFVPGVSYRVKMWADHGEWISDVAISPALPTVMNARKR